MNALSLVLAQMKKILPSPAREVLTFLYELPAEDDFEKLVLLARTAIPERRAPSHITSPILRFLIEERYACILFKSALPFWLKDQPLMRIADLLYSGVRVTPDLSADSLQSCPRADIAGMIMEKALNHIRSWCISNSKEQ